MSAIDFSSMAFANTQLDRAAHLRDNAMLISALEGQAQARAYVIYRDSVLVTRDNGVATSRIAPALARDIGAEPDAIFIGMEGDTPLFAFAIRSNAAEQATSDVRTFADLRMMAVEGTVPMHEIGPLAAAKSLVHWHGRHRYCANCGAATHIKKAGWQRDCPMCEAQHFPRTDPVVIMLVTHGDKCLLGRQSRFPPGMWSCLAGFVEPGETIDDAVRREVVEEAGLRCGSITYLGSQPWPYPSSLMIGCIAGALNEEIIVDSNELEDARWFSREEIRLIREHNHPQLIFTPHSFAIAHHLIKHWVDNG